MGSSYGLQTSNQYFNAPQRLNTGKNLLSGFNAVSAINQQRAANELESERLKLDEKKATSKEARETNLLEIKQDDAAREKATAIFDAWATYLPIDEADPEGSAAALAQGVPVLEKSIQEEFGGKVPASISQHIQALKGGEPGAVLEGLQQYRRQKKLAPEPEKTEYYSPIEATGPGGQLGLYQVNKQTGEPRQVPGIQPPPKSGEIIEMTGPDGQTVSVRRGAGITQGSGAVDKITHRQLQGDVISSLEQLNDLDQIAQDYREAFLTYEGRAKGLVGRVSSKAGHPVYREFTKEKKKFEQGVAQVFNKYRKWVTGAAAAMQELEYLKKSMINPDLSPVEFEASYEQYYDALQRVVRLKNRIMREGTDPASREWGNKMNHYWSSGADDDIQTRGNELLKKLGDKDKVKDLLLKEGY